MTPPPKPRKKPILEELVITEYSDKFKSKPEQIVCCSQSSQNRSAVITPYEIALRAAERLKEKEK